jgi:DNA-binding transcriptional LysR family regulator
MCRLVCLLKSFQEEFPTVSLRLHTEALGGVAQMVIDGRCQLGISGMPVLLPDNIDRQLAGHVTMMPVCAPSHPLAAIDGVIPSAVLREHLQLVVTDRSTLTAGQDFGVTALRDWRLGDLHSKHALLRGGLGWGSMPDAMIAEDLARGRLVRLRVQDGDALQYPLYVIHRTDDQLGPAGRWLKQQFLELDYTLPHTGAY